MPSYRPNMDFDLEDLAEAPRLTKERAPRGVIIGAIAVVVLLGALVIHGSLPDLSPEEIIAMDGYEGEQPTRHIFNLQSLEETARQAKVETKAEVAAINARGDIEGDDHNNDQGGVTATSIAGEAVADPISSLPIAKTEPLPEVVDAQPDNTGGEDQLEDIEVAVAEPVIGVAPEASQVQPEIQPEILPDAQVENSSVGESQASAESVDTVQNEIVSDCLLYTSPSPRDQRGSRMPSSA